MGKCLKTQLKEIVQNSNLVKVDESRIKVLSANEDSTVYINLYVNTDTLVESLNGIFSDGSTSKNILAAGIWEKEANLKYTPNVTLSISNKQNITEVQLSPSNNAVFDYSGICYMINLTYFSNVRGNTIKNNIEKILLTCPSLIFVGIPTISDTKFTVAELNNYSNVKAWTCHDPSYSIDISQLNNTTYFYSNENAVSQWKGTRPDTAYIISGYIKLGNDVDAMLINNARCTKPDSFDTRHCPWGTLDRIEVLGNCSFSTEVTNAINTLKTKGYTVVINDVEQ